MNTIPRLLHNSLYQFASTAAENPVASQTTSLHPCQKAKLIQSCPTPSRCLWLSFASSTSFTRQPSSPRSSNHPALVSRASYIPDEPRYSRQSSRPSPSHQKPTSISPPLSLLRHRSPVTQNVAFGAPGKSAAWSRVSAKPQWLVRAVRSCEGDKASVLALDASIMMNVVSHSVTLLVCSTTDAMQGLISVLFWGCGSWRFWRRHLSFPTTPGWTLA